MDEIEAGQFTPDILMPREKLINNGRRALSNEELIAILLATGTVRKTALELARELLSMVNHDLHQLARWSVQDFCKIEGIGPAKAVSILSAMELAIRKLEAGARENPQIQSSKDAYKRIRHRFEDLSHEEFWMITLNRRNAVIREHRISEGGITATIVDQRKIFRQALEDRSTGIIVFHNHPSGNTNPSDADVQLTKKLKEGGKLLDINLLDHLILAGEAYYSFADEGKL